MGERNITPANLGFTPFLGEASYDDKQKVKKMNDLEEFKRKMRLKIPMTMTFDRALPDGTLDIFTDSGIRIIMPNEHLNDMLQKQIKDAESPDDPIAKRYDEQKRSTYLNYPYNVRVVSVNEEKMEVVVGQRELILTNRDRYYRNLRNAVEQSQKPRLEVKDDVVIELDRMLREELAEDIALMSPGTLESFKKKKEFNMMQDILWERGEHGVVVDGKVMNVNSQGVQLDLGFGVPGYVPINLWHHGWVHGLENILQRGELVRVMVINWRSNKDGGYSTPFKNAPGAYMCSRQALFDDPWKEFPYNVGDYIKVKCTSFNVEPRQAKDGSKIEVHGFFGSISGTEIEIYCDLPRATRGIEVIVGDYYECEIKKINTRTYSCRAKAFRRIRPTMTRYKA